MAHISLDDLAARVERLEEEVRGLKSMAANAEASRQPGWKQIIGSRAGSKMFEEIVKEGRKIRLAERREAQRRDKTPKKDRRARSGARSAK